ncbi:MAG: glycosyltransferase family 4 protein [Clostridia bacterium]|nr:glycosyltransferase family 4 protein [Clostridia bacterium]
MKILFINHAGVWGGSSVSMMQLANALKNRGDSVSFLNTTKPEDTCKRLEKDGFSVQRVPWVMSNPYYNGGVTNLLSPSFWSSMRHVCKTKKIIENCIKNSDCDLVIANSLTLFYTGAIAKKYGKKAICLQRETLPDTLYASHIRKQMAAHFDGLVFISAYDMHFFDKSDIFKTVLYDKVDFDLYDKQEGFLNSDNPKKILFLGGINRLKGTLTALKALKETENCKLLIVSSKTFEEAQAQSYAKTCLMYIRKHGLADKIEIVPPTQQVEQLYAACDTVLFSPTKAHQTRLIYEACAARKPIVVPDYDNLKEFMYGHVFAYRKDDPKSCADALRNAMAGEIDFDKAYAACKAKHNATDLEAEMQAIFDEVNKL